MARLHRLELITRTLHEGGVRTAVDMIVKMGRDAVIGQHRMLFAMSGARALAAPADLPTGFNIRHHEVWDAVSHNLQAQILASARFVWWDVEAMLHAGAELWVGVQDGRPLAYAMTRRGDQVDVYFFPMTERCSLVSHCVTMPEARGQGLYVHMLRHIGRVLASEGQRRLYIDCSDFNFASERGIRRVGYTEIGRGLHRRSGSIVWWQRTPPSVSRMEADV